MGLRRDAARCRLVFDDEALEQFTESWVEESPGQSERGAALGGEEGVEAADGIGGDELHGAGAVEDDGDFG